MPEQHAFQLRQQFLPDTEPSDLRFDGGSVTLPDGSSVDVKALLDEGNGVIVTTNDEQLASILEAFPPLESTDVPDDRRVKGIDDVRKLKQPDLVAFARNIGIADVGDNDRKADVLARIETSGLLTEEAVAEGVEPDGTVEPDTATSGEGK